MAELHLRGWLVSGDGVAIQPVKGRSWGDVIARSRKILKRYMV